MFSAVNAFIPHMVVEHEQGIFGILLQYKAPSSQRHTVGELVLLLHMGFSFQL